MAKFPIALLFASCAALLAGASEETTLTFADFSGGESGLDWLTENDPVMGGVSNSNVTLGADRLVWEGGVKIVPSLDAPGFCFIRSSEQMTAVTQFPDASNYTHLTMRVRSLTPYRGFKFDFATRYHPDTQFTSFKADFPIDFADRAEAAAAKGDSWVDLAIPFTAFTWSWSSYTGEPLHPCSPSQPEYCPKKRDLATIRVLQVWAEGVAGDFHLEISHIGAAAL